MPEHQDDFDTRLEMVEQAIDSHGSYLLRYLHSLTKQWQDAEGLHSDLWVYVIHRFPMAKIGHLGALRRKAYHLFVDHYRKNQRNPVMAVEEPPERAVAYHAQAPYTDEEQAAFRARFFEEYDVDLSDSHKEALWLHAWCGHTYEEIAAILKIPSSTIGDRISQSRKAFADYLNSNP